MSSPCAAAVDEATNATKTNASFFIRRERCERNPVNVGQGVARSPAPVVGV
jgi:hypothetical protein